MSQFTRILGHLAWCVTLCGIALLAIFTESTGTDAACPACKCAEPSDVLATATLQNWHWVQVGGLRDARELPRLAAWGSGIIVVGGGSEMRASALQTTETFEP